MGPLYTAEQEKQKQEQEKTLYAIGGACGPDSGPSNQASTKISDFHVPQFHRDMYNRKRELETRRQDIDTKLTIVNALIDAFTT
jgi:hypothetical protein